MQQGVDIPIEEPKIYQEVFEKIRKAIFVRRNVNWPVVRKPMPNYHQVKCVGISVQPEIVQIVTVNQVETVVLLDSFI